MEFEELIRQAIALAVKEATAEAMVEGKQVAKKLERLTITPREAAKMLGVPLAKMYEILRSNRFPVIRNGTRYLIPIDRFKRWIDQGGRGQ